MNGPNDPKRPKWMQNTAQQPTIGLMLQSIVTKIIAGTNITISPTSGTGAVTINATGGGGGAVSSVTGTSPIVASPTTGAVVVDFNNWYEGNGPPNIVAPVDSIYRDLTTPGLWQCYAETPGPPGLFLTQKADGATNIYRCAEGSGTTLVDAIGGQNATFTGGSYVSALSADQTYALSLNGTGGITFPFDDPPGILSTGVTKYTIEFVVKLSSLPTASQNLFYNSNASGFSGLNSSVGGTGGISGNYGGPYPGFNGFISTAVAIVCLEYDSTQAAGFVNRLTVNTTTSTFAGGTYDTYRGANTALVFGTAVSGLAALNNAVVQSIAFYPFLLTPTQHANHVAALSNAGYADWRQFVVTGEAASSVTGIQASGNPILVGDVTLVAGSDIALSQTGQQIQIAYTGGGGGGSAYDAAVVARTSGGAGIIQDYWPCNDTAGSPSAANSIGGGTAMAANGSVAFGAKAITSDGETCAAFPGLNSSYLTIPANRIPASGSYSFAFVVKCPLYYADTGAYGGAQVLVSWAAGNIFDIAFGAGAAPGPNGLYFNIGSQQSLNAEMSGNVPMQFHVLCDAGGSVITAFINNIACAAYSGTLPRPTGTGAIGLYLNTLRYPYAGYFAKFAIYTGLLSAAQRATDYANL